MGETAEVDYSIKEAEAILDELKTSSRGLSSAEAKARLKENGKNLLEERKKVSTLLMFLSYFKSPLIIILLIATAISAFLGQVVDASIIALMILMSVILNFIQESGAAKAAEKLKETVKTSVMVLRDEKQVEINIEDVAVGDIVILSAGDIVPADARLLNVKDFFVNQSSLTGESFPAEKIASRKADVPRSIAENDNMIFMGTSVVSGTATAVIIRTGKYTEFGKISKKLAENPMDTEFERGVTKFSNLVMKTTIFLVLFIFLFNAITRKDVLESFLFSIAVAVGLTPELLPVIMSVNLARCSVSMAKKGVIVKKLAAISNFGGMDILCTDKTGTLTEDKIKLVKYVDISGKESDDVVKFSYINSFHQSGIKNPLDQAVLEFKTMNITNYLKVDEIPFDFYRKRMSVVVQSGKKRYIIVKGAPEDILKASTSYRKGSKSVRMTSRFSAVAQKQYEQLSSEGYRVLAVAIKNVATKDAYDKNDESSLELLGFIAFLDPPKSDVIDVIKEINGMGIEIKVITGDNELVTHRICTDIGLNIKGVLKGSDIGMMTDDALRVAVERTTIFARVSPDQKTRIISALQANKHVVGYLGDGINDAPALKTADVGISVNSAVDVAKESASIVLTHKSLEVLKDGVIDGRKTFGNTMKYIMMGLSSNFGNMFSVAGAVMFLPFLPMLPIQILLNNFMYDLSQITIPTDNVDEDFTQTPKRWNIKFIKRFMLFFGPISSLFDFITFGIMLIAFRANAAMFQTAWFMESMATQTLVIYIIRTKNTPFFESKPSFMLLMSTLLCVIIAWILPYTFIGKIFGFYPLPINIVLVLLGLVVSYLMIVEIGKRYFYRKNDY